MKAFVFFSILWCRTAAIIMFCAVMLYASWVSGHRMQTNPVRAGIALKAAVVVAGQEIESSEPVFEFPAKENPDHGQLLRPAFQEDRSYKFGMFVLLPVVLVIALAAMVRNSTL